jgi:hypothetical protein
LRNNLIEKGVKGKRNGLRAAFSINAIMICFYSPWTRPIRTAKVPHDTTLLRSETVVKYEHLIII